MTDDIVAQEARLKAAQAGGDAEEIASAQALLDSLKNAEARAAATTRKRS